MMHDRDHIAGAIQVGLAHRPAGSVKRDFVDALILQAAVRAWHRQRGHGDPIAAAATIVAAYAWYLRSAAMRRSSCSTAAAE